MPSEPAAAKRRVVKTVEGIPPEAVAAPIRPSRPPRMGVDTVGAVFLHDDGSLWRCVGYAGQPTATLERLDWDEHEGPRPRRGGVVGAQIFEGFRLLVPEEAS